MNNISLGFIGGGRITQILLSALKRKNIEPRQVIINETDDNVILQLTSKYNSIKIEKEPADVLNQKYLFISLHPPVFIDVLKKISGKINPETVLVSLAPKLTSGFIKQSLNGFNKIIRVIPNAPSIINEGYNPVSFSNDITISEKQQFLSFFNIFGSTPEVDENKLEAYALLTAMGPTYFWFQFYTLKNIVKEFGLDESEINIALPEMVKGALNTMYSELNCNEVNDLVPVKPLSEYESEISGYYNASLNKIYNKIKPI